MTPTKERRAKVWTPEELPEGPLREATRYDPRRDKRSKGVFRGFIDRLVAEKTDLDGGPLTCDLCDRRLKIRSGNRINGGYFPTGAQARDNGAFTYEREDPKTGEVETVGMDVIVMVLYCWRCNKPRPGETLSRVDRVIRSVKSDWRFEDFAEAPGDMGKAIHKAFSVGRRREYDNPPVPRMMRG